MFHNNRQQKRMSWVHLKGTGFQRTAVFVSIGMTTDCKISVMKQIRVNGHMQVCFKVKFVPVPEK